MDPWLYQRWDQVPISLILFGNKHSLIGPEIRIQILYSMDYDFLGNVVLFHILHVITPYFMTSERYNIHYKTVRA
jgi:hypothetical protein